MICPKCPLFSEPPRQPEMLLNNCVISSESAYIVAKYNETVRVKRLTLYYKEAMFKGLSEKHWLSVEFDTFSKGRGHLVLQDLVKGTRYRVYAVASNDLGDSPQSNELWFRTTDAEIEMRTTWMGPEHERCMMTWSREHWEYMVCMRQWAKAIMYGHSMSSILYLPRSTLLSDGARICGGL